MRRFAWIAAFAACDEAGDRPARWDYIHAAIIAPSCTTAGCHSKLTAIAGIDLSASDGAYTFLTGRVCDELPDVDVEAPGNYVFPGQPERSKLIHLLRGENVDVMPPDTPLPDVEIAIVERWILEGAACD
jgi:hypothetical protein